MDQQNIRDAVRHAMAIKLRYAPLAVAGFLLASAAASPAIYAQSDDDHRLDEAWKAALEEQEGILTPQQSATLNTVAYQAAVTRVCEGFELDRAKYAKAVNDIIVPGSDARTDEQNLERQSSILVSLGAAYGLFLAEGTAKKGDFCENAKELKADKESTNLWE
jgi:hypothetical protein